MNNTHKTNKKQTNSLNERLFLTPLFYYQSDKKCVQNWRAKLFSLPYGCVWVRVYRELCVLLLLLLLLLISKATKKSPTHWTFSTSSLALSAVCECECVCVPVCIFYSEQFFSFFLCTKLINRIVDCNIIHSLTKQFSMRLISMQTLINRIKCKFTKLNYLRFLLIRIMALYNV